ncbi:MAG: hypothetical protein WCP39_04530 [Chlamydiota bacterium]
MLESCIIYIDQLKDDHKEKVDKTFSSVFLELEEAELHFLSGIHVDGEFYLTSTHLIIHLNIQAEATLPCSICNKPASYSIEVEGFYHTEPLENIPSSVFDYKEIVREAVLLEVPLFLECKNGHCPERENMEKYIKKEKQKTLEEHFPFADFKL